MLWQPDCLYREVLRGLYLHWGAASDRPVLVNGHSPLVGSVPPRVRFTVRVLLTKIVLVQPPKEQPLAAYWVVVSQQPCPRLRVG